MTLFVASLKIIFARHAIVDISITRPVSSANLSILSARPVTSLQVFVLLAFQDIHFSMDSAESHSKIPTAKSFQMTESVAKNVQIGSLWALMASANQAILYAKHHLLVFV